MKCNLKSFKATRKVAQDGRTLLGLQIGIVGRDDEYWTMIHCGQHIIEFVLQLRGQIRGGTANVFNHCLYYLETHATGIRLLVNHSVMTVAQRVKDDTELMGYRYERVDTTGFTREYLTVPGDILADVIDQTKLSFRVKDLSKGTMAEITERQAKEIRYEKREKVTVAYNSPMAERRLRYHLHAGSPHREEIRDCLKGCLRMARSYSMGNHVELRIGTDGRESFNWIIYNLGEDPRLGKRSWCMNGGWIKHDVGFRTHT